MMLVFRMGTRMEYTSASIAVHRAFVLLQEAKDYDPDGSVDDI